MHIRCIGLGALLLLGACVHTTTPRQVQIADELVFDLLPPAGFGRNLLLTQAASVWFGHEHHDLMFYTEITATAVAIVGALPGGARLFSVVYDGHTITSEGYQDLLRSVTPEYLLADLQITLWPLADVAASFAAANACFAAAQCALTETPDQRHRSLARNGHVVIDIHYAGVPHVQSSTQYEHRERAYRLQIETLTVEELQLEIAPAPDSPEGKP